MKIKREMAGEYNVLNDKGERIMYITNAGSHWTLYLGEPFVSECEQFDTKAEAVEAAKTVMAERRNG